MVTCNKLDLLPHTGYAEEYANEFQQLFSHITKFPISTSDKLTCLLWDSKKMLETTHKGDTDLWEDIKCLIHYVATIDATYVQANREAWGKNHSSPYNGEMNNSHEC